MKALDHVFLCAMKLLGNITTNITDNTPPKHPMSHQTATPHHSAAQKSVKAWYGPMMALHGLFIIMLVMTLSGCGSNSQFATGSSVYEDGYRSGVAAGYAFLCGGDQQASREDRLENTTFLQGYEEGFAAGQAKCRNSQ